MTMNASPEQIKKLLSAGKTPQAIRRRHPGTLSATITYYRRKLGMPPFKRGSKLKPDRAKRQRARALRKAGMTFEEIGGVLGVSRQRAHQYLKGNRDGKKPAQS